MNKAQDNNKFGGGAAETTCFIQSLIFIYILEFVVVIMRSPTERAENGDWKGEKMQCMHE